MSLHTDHEQQNSIDPTKLLSKIEEHKLYSRAREALQSIPDEQRAPGTVNLADLLTQNGFNSLNVYNEDRFFFQMEMKALILAYCAYMSQKDAQLRQPSHYYLQSLEAFKLYCTGNEIEKQLGAGRDRASGPFTPKRSVIEESEWINLLDYAKQVYFVHEMLDARDRPLKVISIRAAALLTGYKGKMEGGWKSLSNAVKRRQVLYHAVTGTEMRGNQRSSSRPTSSDHAGLAASLALPCPARHASSQTRATRAQSASVNGSFCTDSIVQEDFPEISYDDESVCNAPFKMPRLRK